MLDDLKVKIFADGADLDSMCELATRPYIQGLTTNPTLMRQAGVSDYRQFARDVLAAIPNKPISFEVFADDYSEMKRQALEIASWAPNVFVKIPITNTKKESSVPLIRELVTKGVQINATAVFTTEQVSEIAEVLDPSVSAVVSVFAGRIADTGRDPLPIMIRSLEILKDNPNHELIWASPRELLNIFEANEIGCDIITVTTDIIKKLVNVNKDLEQFSLETVQMFYADASSAGYSL
jgi:transaldolase